VAEVDEDTPEARRRRRGLIKLLVERMTVSRGEDGSTEVHITYRFGPPESNGVSRWRRHPTPRSCARARRIGTGLRGFVRVRLRPGCGVVAVWRGTPTGTGWLVIQRLRSAWQGEARPGEARLGGRGSRGSGPLSRLSGTAARIHAAHANADALIAVRPGGGDEVLGYGVPPLPPI
jgi:hypothetical protein